MRLSVVFLSGIFWAEVASAQVAVPSYGSFYSALESSFSAWNETRIALRAESSAADPRRPVLPGVHGRNLELLQDYYVRFYPKVTHGGLRSAATQQIAKASDFRIGALRGFMAEAIYLEKHPDFKYPSKPNTKQVDVYRPQPDGRRGIHGAQIKFHIDGNPAQYAREMLSDHRPQRFVVPDDHVEPLKSYLRTVGRESEIRRVHGIGETSSSIDHRTRQARREAISVRLTPYVLMGAVVAYELGPIAYQLLTGELTAEEAQKSLVRTIPPLGVAIATDQALKLRTFGSGNLRGAAKGNAIVGTVSFVFDTVVQMDRYGSVSNSLHDPRFLAERGTAALGVAGSTVFCVKMGAAVTAATGFGVPIGLGAGLVCSAGIIIATKYAQNEILDILERPEHQRSRALRYEDAQREISKELECLSALHGPMCLSLQHTGVQAVQNNS